MMKVRFSGDQPFLVQPRAHPSLILGPSESPLRAITASPVRKLLGKIDVQQLARDITEILHSDVQKIMREVADVEHA